uniref:CTLH domain-containing protein n=1 Tax=Kalanchoe fedtschenkoi TaxID=63787 RepID=A0A7N0ZUU0_KALFE
MSSLSRELVFLILQFLDEEKFKETVHKLEQESGFFFNMKYFEEEVHNGNWDEVERYLSGFTKVDDNRYSMKIFFEIRKQKYLEALDKHDRSKAVDILVKDLKVFATFNEELFKEITQLLTLDNFRENEQLSKYGDTKSARAIMLLELKKLIEANPLFRDKLQFPTLKNSRLRTLINQSLNWQHQLCKNPRPNPDIKTLFVDHTCGQPNGARAPSPANGPLIGSLPKVGGFPPLGAHGPFPPAPSPVPAPLAGWMSNPAAVNHPAVSAGAIGLGAPSISALKHPRTTTGNSSVDYPSGDSDHISKRTRPVGITDEVNLPVNSMPVPFPGHGHSQVFIAPDDMPKTVARNLNQGSSPKSMDFHPVQQTLLLVGTDVGDIGLWDIGTKERLISKNFKVWDPSACSMPLQATLAKDPGVSVNRVIWSPDGSLFGVAYSKHLVQIYSYHGHDDVRQHLEIDAHVGGVNDLAFSHPNKQLCVITCGDDKTIKVWDAATGAKQYTFEGHEAPVYSVCPHYKENIQFIFSTALDGKIKAWLYDNLGSRVDYDAPGRWCTTMAYSADGTRLFSCGTSKEGESYIVEWNESEGAVRRTYQGFRKRSKEVVQFDTTRNKYLAAGDDYSIKFWDMDNIQLLTSLDADGGLPASPRIRFNKDGTLLAVSANENGIKILANADGLRLLRTFENLSYDVSRASETMSKSMINTISAASVAAVSAAGAAISDRNASIVSIVGMNGETRNMGDIKPRITEEANDKSKVCVWSSDGWEKQKSKFLQVPPGRTPNALSDTRVQFHQDQMHFLVVNETQLAIYETTKLECVKQWVPRENAAPISHATFSCDSQLVYAGFLDASVCVFGAGDLRLRCRINPCAYLPANVSNTSVHPVVIAGHPQEPNQFAVGLSDGGVHVFEPLESENKWGVAPPSENGSSSSIPAAAASAGPPGPDQQKR